jgi:hypothetical protein
METNKLSDIQINQIVKVVFHHVEFKIPSQTQVNKIGEIEEGVKIGHEEIIEQLSKLLRRDPAIFLERHGTKLTDKELSFFECFTENYEVNWYLQTLYKNIHEPTQYQVERKNKIIKNRRYAYLQNLISEGEYFSEESMKIRSPSLYYHYIGKYRTEDKVVPYDEKESLVNRILRGYDMSNAREEIESIKQNEEEETDSSSEEDKMLTNGNSKSEKEERESADFEEFVAVMKGRFMDGKDSEYTDYNSIDTNESLDNLQQISRDAEEKYFDDD